MLCLFTPSSLLPSPLHGRRLFCFARPTHTACHDDPRRFGVRTSNPWSTRVLGVRLLLCGDLYCDPSALPLPRACICIHIAASPHPRCALINIYSAHKLELSEPSSDPTENLARAAQLSRIHRRSQRPPTSDELPPNFSRSLAAQISGRSQRGRTPDAGVLPRTEPRRLAPAVLKVRPVVASPLPARHLLSITHTPILPMKRGASVQCSAIGEQIVEVVLGGV
eukprot:SAG11_NODE_265_length_11509_cov_26.341455_6_plen_223_part_00